METDKLVAEELFAAVGDSLAGLLHFISSLDEKQINTIPFKDSWTAAQLSDHVAKSIEGIAKALNLEGKPAERDPAKRKQELGEMFLDYTVKFKSPEFILPTNEIYSKDSVIAGLQKSVKRLKEESDKANLYEAVHHRAFGEITKLELLYFVKFHTQRHLHQLKNIHKIITCN